MIVITGASDGLGQALAKLYQQSGKTVVNISRRESKHADINLLHDLTVGSEIIQAANEVLKIDEPLEILINNVGVYSNQPLGQITEDEIKRSMASNVKAPILLVSTLIDRIKADKTDIAIIVSSIADKASKGEAVYGASKWALRGFTKNLQLEFKNLPNRVISFSPGGFQSKLFVKGSSEDKTKDGSTWMKTEDVAICLKQLLDLPQTMDVSEITVNRKAIK